MPGFVPVDLRGTTPRPWSVSRTRFHGLADSMNYVTVHNGTVSICKMTGSEGMQVDEVQDAHLIVRAVNCHDDLLAALKAARDMTMATEQPQETRLNDVFDIVSAALAKAEGR